MQDVPARITTLPILLLLAAGPPLLALEAPLPVSPGGLEASLPSDRACPTFSWSGVAGATGYELMVFDVRSLADEQEAHPVLRELLVGAASSWTPPGDRCLVAGEDYAWVVRALTRSGSGALSPPRFFSLPGAPSRDEVEAALEVLERYLESRPGSAPGPGDALAEEVRIDPDLSRRPVPRSESGAGEPPGSTVDRSVSTATAAIRGEQADASGDTLGVAGIGHSPEGAGLGAANAAGGPDLLLDGELDGEVDAQLSQAGLDRASASPQTYSITNSGGGGMTLEVDGVEVVTTATDLDTLGELSCAGGEVAQWSGSAWICSSNDDTTLSEAEVETFVTNGPLDFDAGSTLGGQAIATGPHATDTDTRCDGETCERLRVDDGTNPNNVLATAAQAAAADALYWGDSAVALGAHTADTTLSESEVETFVTNGALDLATGSTLAGAALSTGPHTVDTNSGGTVTQIDTGAGLSGGPVTTSGTLSLDTAYTDGRYLGLAGGELVGDLALTATGTADATQGYPSQGLGIAASVFDGTLEAEKEFRWQVLPIDNNDPLATARLTLAFGSGGVTPTPTGLYISADGTLEFAPGQGFPGADTLAGLSCGANEIAKWSGTEWACAPDDDDDALGDLSCADSMIARWDAGGTSWKCTQDADTLSTIPGCTDQEIPRWDASAATWKCTADRDTTYTNGNQLGLAGSTFNVIEGSGSGLDADTLDSMDSSAFAAAAHGHTGSDIQDGTLTGADIQDGSLSAADIANVRPGISTSQLSGMGFACALLSDDTISCWGLNTGNQLESPAGRFAQVSSHSFHSCALRSDGSVECWGVDDTGQASPPADSFVHISAGGYHSCGVRIDSSVACWGQDLVGESSPPGGSFSSVDAGWIYSCGLLSGGQIVCWGDDRYALQSPPAGTFKAVSAGWNHACGIRSDDSVACWGLDDFGQSTPPSGSFVQVSAGREHSCGVRPGGGAVCWGRDTNGETEPPAGTYQQVIASFYFSCGLGSDGGVACWGRDTEGETMPPLALR